MVSDEQKPTDVELIARVREILRKHARGGYMATDLAGPWASIENSLIAFGAICDLVGTGDE